MLKLYFAPGSSSMAAHIALHEVGVPFEAQSISFARREQREPWYVALNPQATVPLLLIDDRPLTEVAAILFYLARRFPESGLWPEDDVEAQAQVISWMSFLAASVHPARSRGPEFALKVYALAERRLQGAWAVEHYSIADIHLFRLFWRFSHSDGFVPDGFPKLLAHRERMLQRPAVRKTIELEAAIGYELGGFNPPSLERA